MAGHSLEDLHESLMDFALESLMKGSNVHVHALRLLQILGTENIELRSPSVERLNGMWKELATWLDQEAKSQSILKLISVFVRNPACQSSIISAVSREKIQKLLMIPTGEAIDKMKDDKILLLLTCLDLLTNFSTVEPLQWYGQADEAFKTPEIAKIIAEGFSRGHEEMFTCCLNLAQHTNFPRERITRLMHKSPVKRQTDCRRARPEDTFVPVQVLKKQSREIDRILKDFTNIPSNMTISSAAILMQHQIAYSKTVNRIHEQEIEHSQRFISSLKLQIATMEAERDSVRSLLSHYDITNEKAQRKIALCEETITSLQIALTQVNGKIEEDAKKLELARKEREEAKAKEKELKEAVRSLNSEVQEQKKSAEIMQKAMDEQKKEVTKKDARIQHLETKLKESESLRQRVVDLMMSGKIGN
ncbi:uncharacterized protein LOC132264367 [Phlebotomus argentipes]|uniref:uncharacterized protein LOC132264367 n=1 Tax=Phlebotomus argentipes TaxID=94469 RepID=UPI002893466F|nr:uncharacterized protein LOC132264367 [Phlebotomus argentipes]